MATMLQVFFIREEIFIDLSFINLIFEKINNYPPVGRHVIGFKRYDQEYYR